MGWWSRLFSSPSPPPSARPTPAPPTAKPTPAEPAVAGASGARPFEDLLPWLLDSVSPAADALHPAERRAIEQIDKVLATGQLPDTLLPRAAAFLPQLVAMLRQDDASAAAVAERIARDAPLVAEVMRAATAAAQSAAGPVQDLTQAVQRIGAVGVHKAVARVIFRPMYSGSSGGLGSRAAVRLWEHGERLSELASERARLANLPALDGYLAGLLHGTGWTVVLRLFDQAHVDPVAPLSTPVLAALPRRAHALFGLAAQRWSITPGFTALGEDARRHALEASALPLAQVLHFAIDQRMLELKRP